MKRIYAISDRRGKHLGSIISDCLTFDSSDNYYLFQNNKTVIAMFPSELVEISINNKPILIEECVGHKFTEYQSNKVDA